MLMISRPRKTLETCVLQYRSERQHNSVATMCKTQADLPDYRAQQCCMTCLLVFPNSAALLVESRVDKPLESFSGPMRAKLTLS